MMNWDNTMSGWIGWWMWIPIALLVALVALGVVAAIRAMTVSAPQGAEAPLAIAARRLAHGEITKDEFEAIRSTLAGAPR